MALQAVHRGEDAGPGGSSGENEKRGSHPVTACADGWSSTHTLSRKDDGFAVVRSSPLPRGEGSELTAFATPCGCAIKYPETVGRGFELEPQRPCVSADRRRDPFGPGENLFIAEPEDGPAEGFQLHLSEMISQDDVIAVVDSAVDFEDQPEAVAGEVGDIPADGMLASEAMAVDPGAAEAVPQSALRQTGGSALGSCESCALASHGAIMDYFEASVSPLSLWERDAHGQASAAPGGRPASSRQASRFACRVTASI